MRVDLYTTVHKAQRFALFRLGQEIGKTDFNNDTQAQATIGRLKQMIHLLRDHAANEEKYIHPLYRKLGTPPANLENEHLELDEGLRKLEKLIEETNWPGIYAAYNRFLSQYLAHLDEEEEAQRNILWAGMTDAEMGEVFMRFKGERAPQAALADLQLMFPALSTPEVIHILKGMKSGPAFEIACDIAKSSIDESSWKEIAVAANLLTSKN